MFFFIYFFVVFFVSLVFFLLVMLLFYGFAVHFGKAGAFECGFQPFSNYWVSFSMPFFVVSLVFLLFDVEIILLSFPPILGVLGFLGAYWFILFLITLATCYEWLCGALEWLSSL